MGMSIDEAIEILQERDKYMEYVTDNDSEAFKMAINTMRKYEKIQEILNSAGYIKNGTVYSYTYDEDSRVNHIREVVKYGQ